MANPGLFLTFQDQYSLSSGSDPIDGYSHIMGQDIAAALTANGWPCRAIPSWPIENERLRSLMFDPRPPFVMNMNLIPFVNLDVGTPPSEVPFYRVWTMAGVSVISMLIDQAFHHLPRVFRYADDLRGFGFAALEKSDAPALLRMGVPAAQAIFLPWGGPPPDANPKPFAARKYGLIFHGGLIPVRTESELIARADSVSLPEHITRAVVGAIERVVGGENTGVEAAFTSELMQGKADSATLSVAHWRQALMLLDEQTRAIRRHRFLSAFARLPVDFFGHYPDDFRKKFPRATFHSGKTFREIMEVMRNAQISLCENINWRDNAHLRLTYALPFGCLPVAESNDRLAGDFTDMKNMVLTSFPYDDVAAKVEAVLADPRLGQAMVDAAMPIYQSRYAWRETVKVLAPFLPPPEPIRPPATGKKKAGRSRSAKGKKPKSARTARSPASPRRGSRR